MTQAIKLDLTKFYKPEYSAPKKPTLLHIGWGEYLQIAGKGAPGSESYIEKIGALYAAAYTMKFASKEAGKDFVVCKLECLSWGPGGDASDLAECPMEDWSWELMIRMPDFISSRDLSSATKKIQGKGDTPGIEALRVVGREQDDCIQMLHVGPYDQEGSTLESMRDFASREGLSPHGPHHEIYLSDPRRVEAARLKTILRMYVTGASSP